MPFDIKFDGALEIATGRSRKETNWKNKKVQWVDLLDKFATTQRTHETYAEYISSKKTRQDEIKDIGGFVGGYLTSGRRKPENVAHRQLITLDIDFAPVDIWADFCMMFGEAAAIYSTHKHSDTTPRFRLIIPLSREVFSDEYMAISRKIAGMLGIEFFDHTTFQPSRLMYWPSTAKDGIFYFQHQDGPWMDPDKILSTYRDWKDSSEWPVSDRYNKAVQNSIKKQGDPLEKPGVIGAFCRTYTISEVIDAYLADVYESCDIENRYTFKEGSTAAGLVVYDDKYAYSHHGTDPISGKLCNAFDLVRIHRFGLKDEDAKDGTPGNKMPSFMEMQGLAVLDKNVKLQLGSERLAEAKYDFQNIDEEPEIEYAGPGASIDETEPDLSWLKTLDVDRKGNPLTTISNIIRILQNDPALKDRFALNAFTRHDKLPQLLPRSG